MHPKTLPQTATPYLSVIIPAFNDAASLRRHLPEFICQLQKETFRWEIIISDDGSVDWDATQKVAEALGCIYVRGDKNRGKGAALRQGMRAARGEIFIYTDSDIPFDYETFQNFVRYLREKEYDMVAGDRKLPQSRYYTEVPLLRKVGSQIIGFFLGRLFTGGWYDTQCGIKGFRREVAFDLLQVSKINRYAFDVECLYLALKRNYDIKHLPVTLRRQEPSHVSVVRDGLQMLFDVCRIYLFYLLGFYKKK